MKIGKHMKNKEQELKDYFIDELEMIRQINESNSYMAPEIRKRKISEICTDTIYNLSNIDNKKGLLE